MRVEGLVVDCRMYRASGIGVYVQNILRRLGQFIPEERITLLGGAAVVDELAACMPRAAVRTVHSRIYTLREQWELLLKGRRGNWAWWSPHFNIPVCHRGPLVVTVHDLFHLTRPEVRRDPVKLAYARMMFTAVRRFADKIICVSRFTANEFERLVGARAGQLEVIHNGVDESWYGPVSGARK